MAHECGKCSYMGEAVYRYCDACHAAIEHPAAAREVTRLRAQLAEREVELAEAKTNEGLTRIMLNVKAKQLFELGGRLQAIRDTIAQDKDDDLVRTEVAHFLECEQSEIDAARGGEEG